MIDYFLESRDSFDRGKKTTYILFENKYSTAKNQIYKY